MQLPALTDIDDGSNLPGPLAPVGGARHALASRPNNEAREWNLNGDESTAKRAYEEAREATGNLDVDPPGAIDVPRLPEVRLRLAHEVDNGITVPGLDLATFAAPGPLKP